MKLVKLWMLSGALAILTLTSCNSEVHNPVEPEKFAATAILQWNEYAYEAFGGVAYQNSLMASRLNAMTHLAMHDALNAIHPMYERYAFVGTDAKAHPVAAAATAAYTVLVAELPDRKPFLDSVLNLSLLPIADGDAKLRGIQLGDLAGKAVLQARHEDGSQGNPISPIAPSTTPGIYQAVPPFDFIFAPYWKDMKPFGLERGDEFRSDAPPSIISEAYAASFDEVKNIGRKGSAVRTTDQTAYAYYWYEFSEAGWNRVARVITVNKQLDLWQAARLFALVDIAMADAYIAGWDAKIHYNLW